MGRNIVLTGFMAAGKSAVGRRVAQRLGWRFVDLDVEVERAAGRSIPEIFSGEGEEGFRRWEAEALARVLGEDRRVIATGGGVLLREENRRLLQEHLVINLRVSADEAVARAAASSTPRPLLGGPDPLGRARELLARRAGLYDAVAIQVETEGRPLSEVAEEVWQRVRQEMGP